MDVSGGDGGEGRGGLDVSVVEMGWGRVVCLARVSLEREGRGVCRSGGVGVGAGQRGPTRDSRGRGAHGWSEPHRPKDTCRQDP